MMGFDVIVETAKLRAEVRRLRAEISEARENLGAREADHAKALEEFQALIRQNRCKDCGCLSRDHPTSFGPCLTCSDCQGWA